MAVRRDPTFTELTSTLGHLLHRPGVEPWDMLLAVATSATRRRYPPSVVRRWVLACPGRPDLVAAAQGHAWDRAVTVARSHVRETATTHGLRSRRLRTARRLVGRLLVPCSSSPATEERARAVVALVGVEVFDRLSVERPEEERIDGPRLSRGRVAVALGVGEATAQRWLADTEALGWVRRADRSVRGPGGTGPATRGRSSSPDSTRPRARRRWATPTWSTSSSTAATPPQPC